MKKVFFLLLFIPLLCGCSNLFVAPNTVLDIDSPKSDIVDILSITSNQPGRILTKSQDDSYLFSINQINNQITIDQYTIKNNSLVNFISSDTAIFDVQAAKNGIFYTKLNSSDSNNIQVVWSTYDKSIERIITDTTENSERKIYAYGNDNVIYINNSSQIVFSNSNGIKQVFDLGRQLEVYNIVWSTKNNVGFLIAQEEGNNYLQLFQLILNEKTFSITPTEINVSDMSLSEENNQLIFSINDDNNTIIYILDDISIFNPRQLFSNNLISTLTLDKKNDCIYYAATTDNPLYSTIWRYNLNDEKEYQISSPLRLVSSIFFLRGKLELFYSSQQLSYLEASNLVQTSNFINHLTYQLPD